VFAPQSAVNVTVPVEELLLESVVTSASLYDPVTSGVKATLGVLLLPSVTWLPAGACTIDHDRVLLCAGVMLQVEALASSSVIEGAPTVTG
jgi:hypothetical protein